MENYSRQRNHSDQSNYSSRSGAYNAIQTPPRSSSGAYDRYRQLSGTGQDSNLQQPSNRQRHSGSSSMNYYMEDPSLQVSASPVTSAAMSFASDFGNGQDRAQSYSQYGSNVMYSVAQTSPGNTSYDTSQQYHPRQNTTIEVLSSNFGGPTPFYHSGEGSSVSPVASQHQTPSQYNSVAYQQQNSMGRTTYQHPYSPSLTEITSSNHGNAQGHDYDQGLDCDSAMIEYEKAQRLVFQDVRSGQLAKAGQSLLEISTWLLSNATDLGYIRDNQDLHSQRSKMWNDFNTCWLAVLQKQKDLTIQMVENGRSPRRRYNLMTEPFLEKLGREIVRLCDGMERHGLVDYQMGVWEEEIIELLSECLKLLDRDGRDD